MAGRFSPDEGTCVIHQLLSHYAHSHPVSFMRNNDQRRDGLPNDVDKTYLPGVLRWLADLIDGASEAYRHLPSGVRE